MRTSQLTAARAIRLRPAAMLLAMAWLVMAATPLTTKAQSPASGARAPDSGSLSGELVEIVAPRTTLEIPERFARVLQFTPNIVQVDGFDPTVINVSALSRNQLRVHAMGQGVTTMVVTDEAGKSYSVEVFVAGDARLLQAILERQFPNAAVTATNLRGSILLRGWVTEPQQISQIVEISEMYATRVINQMRVGGPQEVQLNVRVMEVQRSKIRAFGVNWAYLSDSFSAVSTPGPITALQAFSTPINGTPSATLGGTGLASTSAAFGITGPNSAFHAFLDALKEEGLLKISAEPVLVTRSGEASRMINGGEFPIPVPQGLGTVAIEWREFGVTLESLPIVLSPTRLKQSIVIEVSEKDQASAVTISGTTVPGLTTRRVQTQVEMNFGDTFVIGGLINTRQTSETDKLPVLGDIPGLGVMFRRVRTAESETELLVLITPQFTAPLAPDQVPEGGPGKSTDSPTDRELYWDGTIEVPSYGDRCQGANCQPDGYSGSMHGYDASMGPGGTLTPIPSDSMSLPPAGYSPSGSPSTLPPSALPPASVPPINDAYDGGLISPPGAMTPPTGPSVPEGDATSQAKSSRRILPASFWSASKSDKESAPSGRSSSGSAAKVNTGNTRR